MDDALRRGWTQIIQAEDIDDHMHQVGQAAANAALLVSLLGTQNKSEREKLLLVGGGTGQFLDYVDAAFFKRFDITVSDINPAFLRVAQKRFARADLQEVQFILDDIESTALAGPFDVIAVVMVLEHIDWKTGLSKIHRLGPRRLHIIIQRNPDGLTEAIAPQRELNPSMKAFAASARPVILSSDELIEFLRAMDYRLVWQHARPVPDGKSMLGLSFCRD